MGTCAVVLIAQRRNTWTVASKPREMGCSASNLTVFGLARIPAKDICGSLRIFRIKFS